MPVTVTLVSGSFRLRETDFVFWLMKRTVPNARVQGGDGYRTRRRVVNVETCRAWTDEIAEMAECPIMFGQVELGIAVLCMVGIEVDEAIWLGRIATRTAMGQHHPRWSNRSQ